MATHESFTREAEVEGSSDRVFGLIMAAVFAVLTFSPLLRHRPLRWWSLPICVVFLSSAVFCPRLLRRLNQLWLRFGLLLHAVVNPVVMGLLFFGTVTPIALLFRWLGKDALLLRFDRQADTYWIDRRPPGPAPDTMPRQF